MQKFEKKRSFAVMSEQPYLSVVVTARNDDHAGDFLGRMTIFIRGLAYQSLRHKLSLELIIVEWNPPPDKPLLHEVLPKPEGNAFLRIRYIIIPHAIHKQYRTHASMGLYQMTAKNVGIRRASADYVLCTNVDVVFSNALASFLSKKCLKKGFVYRSPLCHIPTIKDAKFRDDIGALLQFAEQNIICTYGKSEWSMHLRIAKWRVLHALGLGRIGLSKKKPELFPYYTMSSNGCGDFTLMHKAHWNEIKGYLEIDGYSMNIDTLGLGAAIATGCKQIVLPPQSCVYHISHAMYYEPASSQNGLGPEDDPFKALKQRIQYEIRMPHLKDSALTACKEMIRIGKAFSLNDSTWGFEHHQFREHILEPNTREVVHHPGTKTPSSSA